MDFLLADPEVLEPVLLIEVDDSSHETAARQSRDDFVDGVYRKSASLFSTSGTRRSWKRL